MRLPLPLALLLTYFASSSGIAVAEEGRPQMTESEILFSLKSERRTSLGVFDRGSDRLVRTLLRGETLAAGSHTVYWDGRDAAAHPAGSGVYYYVLNADGEHRARQMLVVR